MISLKAGWISTWAWPDAGVATPSFASAAEK